MPYELKDAKITHISLVDKGANGVPFAIIKEEGAETVQKSIVIAKADKPKQIVYGVVYQPDVVDAHGDKMSAEEIEKAAHGFMESKNTYNIDKQHDLEADEGYVVESYIAPCDMQLGDQTIKKGSWVAGVKVTNDETWAAIEKGEITGFSMWGVGKRVKVEEASSTAESETVEKGLLHSIIKAIQGGFNTISKGVVRERFEQSRKTTSFWDAWYAFESTVRRYNWQMDRYEFETDETTIREAIEDLKSILQEVLTSDNIMKSLGEPPADIAKAGRKISAARLEKLKNAQAALSEILSEVEDKEDNDMNAEAIQKALEPLVKQVETLVVDVAELKKGAVPAEEQPASSDEIAKALEPITKQLEALGKDVQLIKSARGLSAQPNEEGQQIQKEAGLFAGKL
jgi:hypothetical protein